MHSSLHPLLRRPLALAALLVPLAALPLPAMDSTLAGFPLVVDEILDMEYEYDNHEFVLERPTAFRASVVARGFDPQLMLIDDDKNKLAIAEGSAGSAVEIAAFLPAGSYRLAVVAPEPWIAQATYRLEADGIPVAELGAPLPVRPSRPEGDYRFTSPLRVSAVRVPPPLLASSPALLTHDGGGEVGLLQLDAQGRVVARGEDALTLTAGTASTPPTVLLRAPLESRRIGLRAVTRGAGATLAQLDGRVANDGPSPRVRIPDADVHPVDLPSNQPVSLYARSEDVYLDLYALDASGRTIAEAREGSDGYVMLELPAGHDPVAAIVVSGRGKHGSYTLSATSTAGVDAGSGRPYALELPGVPRRSGTLYPVDVAGGGSLRAVRHGEGQMVLLDGEGRFLTLSEPLTLAEELAPGDWIRVTDVEEAQPTLEGTDPSDEEALAAAVAASRHPDGVRDGDQLIVRSVDANLDSATVAFSEAEDDDQFTVALAGIEPLSGPVVGQRLELDVDADQRLYLLLDGGIGRGDDLRIETTTHLLDVEDSIDDGEDGERLNEDETMSAQALAIEAGQLIELELPAGGLAHPRLQLRLQDGSLVASAAAGTLGDVRLAWMADKPVKATVEVIAERAGKGEKPVGNGTYTLIVHRSIAEVTQRQVDLGRVASMALAEVGQRPAVGAEVAVPAGTRLIARWQAGESGRLDLSAHDAAGAALGRASTVATGADEVALVTSAAAGGSLTLLAAASEAHGDGTFTVYRLPARPAATVKKGADPRPSDPGAGTQTPTAVTDLAWSDGTAKRTLDDYRGKVVLFEFWASWCGPCRSSLPHIEALHRRFGDKGLVVLGVNDEDAKDRQQATKELGLTFPNLADDDGTLQKSFAVESIPRTVLIGPDGKVLADLTGARDGSALLRLVSEALAPGH